MVSTKWTYHKERSFSSNYFNFFLKIVSVYGPLIKGSFDVLTTQIPIFLLFVSAAVLFDSVFSLWVSLTAFLCLFLYNCFSYLWGSLVIWSIYEFFFSIWVFFHKHSQITGLQGKAECISLTPHYHFYLLHRHLHISWVITAESSPLHIASSWTRTGNLWFPSASR